MNNFVTPYKYARNSTTFNEKNISFKMWFSNKTSIVQYIADFSCNPVGVPQNVTLQSKTGYYEIAITVKLAIKIFSAFSKSRDLYVGSFSLVKLHFLVLSSIKLALYMKCTCGTYCTHIGEKNKCTRKKKNAADMRGMWGRKLMDRRNEERLKRRTDFKVNGRRKRGRSKATWKK